MTLATTYNFRERPVFDIKSVFDTLLFIMSNIILALIFLFLTLEEIEWSLFSSRQKLSEITFDDTSWNIKELFSLLIFQSI